MCIIRACAEPRKTTETRPYYLHLLAVLCILIIICRGCQSCGGLRYMPECVAVPNSCDNLTITNRQFQLTTQPHSQQTNTFSGFHFEVDLIMCFSLLSYTKLVLLLTFLVLQTLRITRDSLWSAKCSIGYYALLFTRKHRA